jgi:uncharacterized membrane protein
MIRAISADGSVVAAENLPSSYRWDAIRGLVNIGHLAIPGFGPNHVTYVYGISAAGSMLVGSSIAYGSHGSKMQAFCWTQQTGIMPLVNLSVMESVATGVSDDGRTIVGWIIVETGQHAVLWRDGKEILRLESGTTFGGISRNGVWATGSKAGVNNVRPIRWSANTGMTILGTDTAGRGNYGRAISNDGNVVVGQGDAGPENGGLPFRWTMGEGMQFLGERTYEDQGYATALSTDGNTVVGASNAGAFIWTKERGRRRLKDVLEANYGMDLHAWYLGGAWSISDDGLTVAGHGIHTGVEKGFILRLENPPHVTVKTEEGSMRLSFEGVLQSSPDLKQWSDMEPQPSSPYLVTPMGSSLFFRVRNP